jgi:hypothetical protein
VWALPPSLEFVFLVSHAAKRFHLFRRLLWIVDLAAITRDRPVDWDEVERLAQRARRRVATAVALTFARRLGVDVPQHMTQMAPVLERSAALMRLLDASRPFDARSDRALAFVLVDGIGPKARLAAADLVSPPRHWSRRREAAALVRTAVRVLPRIVRAVWPRIPTVSALRIHASAFVLLVAARALLPRVGTAAAMKRLARSRRSRPRRSEVDVRRTAFAVRRVARTLRLECLHESVALAASLHRDGYAPALVLGCRRTAEGTWTAHAWVELDGDAVEPLGASGHAAIARFSARDDWEAGPAEERLADDDR